MNLPKEINIFNFNVGEESFIYDCDTGFLTKSAEILDDILKLFPLCTRKEIINKLANKYKESQINNCLDQISELYDKGILFNNSRIAVERTPKYSRQSWDDSNLLVNLWLNVSHDCNLRCIYCFGHGGSYGGERGIMEWETAKKCIDYWYKFLNKQVSETSVTFFGGEPLMNVDVIEHSIEYINTLLLKDNIGVKYIITTNGTILNDRLINLLKNNDVYFSISIDGGKLIQDKNRPYNSGEGSYEKIKENVTELKKIFDVIPARITLTHENVPLLKDTVIDLWEIGFTDVVYEFVTIDDPDMSIFQEDIELLRSQVRDLNKITYNNIVNKKRKFFSNTLRYASFINNNSIKNECSFQSPYTIMFTPFGDIYKCHRMMDNNEHKVGDIDSGISWSLFSDNTKNYIEETECSDCWAKRICGGGCAQENFIYTGDYSKPYNLLCEEIKMLAEESLKFYTKMHIEDKEAFNRIFLKS